MAKGTSAGLLDGPKPQSVYKHAILDQHAIRYATMTASKLTPKRCVLFDGFAGRVRFDSGQAASAEYMMLQAQKVKNTTQIDIYLVEKNRPDFVKLDSVADEYRGRGITIVTRNGECEDYLDDALEFARGASLFLFLDPCGAILPFETLKPLLTKRRIWPRTELLMNFSADLVRRAGGQYKAGQLHAAGVAQVDKVCGGDWWRDVALRAHVDSDGTTWESAAEAVATEYANRLTAGTGYGWVLAPVRRQVHHQPVYYLIFLTSDDHGYWVFGVAAAKAREQWLRALGPDEDELLLFDTVDDQIKREHQAAIAHIASNIRSLVSDGRDKPVIKHTAEIFGDSYGEAKETAFTAAVRQLERDGEIEHADYPGGNKPKPHKFVLRRKS